MKALVPSYHCQHLILPAFQFSSFGGCFEGLLPCTFYCMSLIIGEVDVLLAIRYFSMNELIKTGFFCLFAQCSSQIMFSFSYRILAIHIWRISGVISVLTFAHSSLSWIVTGDFLLRPWFSIYGRPLSLIRFPLERIWFCVCLCLGNTAGLGFLQIPLGFETQHRFRFSVLLTMLLAQE